MKRTFDTWSTRLLNGGATLSDAEHHVLSLLIAELPPHLRQIVEAQFESYNLVQREVDGRTLNFYRVKPWGTRLLTVSPLLESKLEVAPLVKLSLRVKRETAPLHATLTAVNGRAFDVSFNREIPATVEPADFTLEKVTQAWVSNFPEEVRVG